MLMSQSSLNLACDPFTSRSVLEYGGISTSPLQTSGTVRSKTDQEGLIQPKVNKTDIYKKN